MISVADAYKIVQKNLPPWTESSIGLDALSPDLTAEDLYADRSYPPFDRVTMDGICVAWESLVQGLREFRIVGTVAAGSPQGRLVAVDTCLEVMTGAPLPTGANLVIPYEHLKIEGDVARVTLNLERKPFENVHREASDCQEGAMVLRSGQRLNGPRWGIAASFGYGRVRTLSAPRVNIVSTGDEIVEVESRPLPHQIRRSNAYALRASLLHCGYRDVDLDHLPDDQEKLRTHYALNAPKYDVMIYSGGVSKGKFDYLPQLWCDLGVTRLFHEVSQRPGKPLWFGKDERLDTVIMGLPGNPVSSLVCLHRYFIRQRKVHVRLASEVVFAPNLTLFVPVRIEYREDGVMLAEPLKIKNSGEFIALAESDGFIELPREKSVFKKEESYSFFPWTVL